jgi:flavodoxin
MKPFVVYFTRTGNTKKAAEAMAGALKTGAHNVKGVKSVPEGSFIIAGSGVYGGRAGGGITDFLDGLPAVKKGKGAVFETSGDGEKVVAGEQMRFILESKGYEVKGSFVCPGRTFGLWRRGYPRPEDLDRAGKFALSLMK